MLAIATATAALAACVASRSAAAVEAALCSPTGFEGVGVTFDVSASGRGTAGRIWVGRLLLGPVGIAFAACWEAADAALFVRLAAVALTSSAEGFESTGGGGAFAPAGCLGACWIPDLGSAEASEA